MKVQFFLSFSEPTSCFKMGLNISFCRQILQVINGGFMVMVHMYLWNRSARNNRLWNRAAHLQAARKTEQDVCGVIRSFLLLLEDLWHHRSSRKAQITGWQVGKKSQVGFNYYTGQIAVGAAVSQGNITCSQGTEVLSFSSCTYFSALSLYTYVVTEL